MMKGSQFIHMFIYIKQTTFDHKNNHNLTLNHCQGGILSNVH